MTGLDTTARRASVIAIDGKTIRGSKGDSHTGAFGLFEHRVTANAMGCQKEIIRKISEGKADYAISLKGNQPALLEDFSLYFERFSGEIPNFVTRVKDHGRLEKRDYYLLTDLS